MGKIYLFADFAFLAAIIFSTLKGHFMKICSIASGSSGNCVYVGDDETHILIDAGISGKRVKAGLDAIGVDIKDIQALLITHEHSDHISGVGVLSRKYKMPIYSKEKTLKQLLKSRSVGVIDPELFNHLQADDGFMVGNILVTPFASNHDAVDPLCYTFTTADKKIGFATDLGSYNDYIKDHLKGANALYLEANHDVSMLEVGPYPFFLKQRILSDVGHLSNDLSADLICELYHEGLSHIILAHLSHENNMPDVAHATVKHEIDARLDLKEGELTLHVAKRSENSALVEI